MEHCMKTTAFQRRILVAAMVSMGCASIAMASTPPQTTTYNYGENINGNPDNQIVTYVTNPGTTALPLKFTLTGDAAYKINTGQSCGSSLPAHSTCYMVITYNPATSGTHRGVLSILPQGFNGNLLTQHVTLTGVSAAMAPGVVTSTNGPQVAQYSITPPYPATVVVNFGPTTAYGLYTWSQPADGTDPLTMLVAGMTISSTYHMSATVTLANGVSVNDVDHTFTTGTYPEGYGLPALTSTTVGGETPSPGIEMVDNTYSLVSCCGLQAFAANLSGNTIWGYDYPGATGGTIPQPVKLLPNGHILTTLSFASQFVPPTNPNALVITEEIDLAGNVIKSIDIAQLNTAMTAAGYTGPKLLDIHHDALELPNGHWIIITNGIVPSSDLPGYTGSPANVIGDIIVDLNENLVPVWWWNEFNVLDVNRPGFMWPDWTHTNGLVYSPTDGNLIVSIRNQSWVVKINYANGTGDGSVLWHLGYEGDFTLVNGTAPTDWQYGEHAPALASANSAGTFNLIMMDNGNNRQFPSGVTCGTSGNPPCLYSTVPEFEINESAMTATLLFHYIAPSTEYSYWGGNAEVLPNGNIEADFCAGAGTSSDVYEMTPAQTMIWHQHSNGQNLYRSQRIGSLYPGVTW
jgi:hypothetical protein